MTKKLSSPISLIDIPKAPARAGAFAILGGGFLRDEETGLVFVQAYRNRKVIHLYWLTEKELAAHLDLAPKTLKNWRSLGKGPSYHDVGYFVRYRVDDVVVWLDQIKINPKQERAA